MERYRLWLKPDMPLDFGRHPYLIALYNCPARRMVVYKASQLGASEYAVSYALYAADQRSATVLYVFPTRTALSDFSSARLGPAIEASAYLASLVVDATGAENKYGADRVMLKRVRNRFLYLRGAQVSSDGMAPQLKSIDADVLILDEVDEMDSRAPTIAVKRLGHSELAAERWISTPTYPGRGIHAKWLESDQREWLVRCQHCGERQPLTLAQIVVEWDTLGRPVHWHGQKEGRAFVACRSCNREIERLGPGEWVASYPGRELVGFHLTKLFSPTAKLLDLVQGLTTTDETKRREAYNQDFGEPYTPKGGQLDAVILDDCRRDYAHGPLAGVRPVAGVDVGKVLHVIIRGQVEQDVRQLFAGEATWATLGALLSQYRVRCTVIDALPETTKAREFQASLPDGAVWLAYYPNQPQGSKRQDVAVWNAAEGVVNVDRTRALDQMFSRFYEHRVTLPANVREVRDYYAHLTAPVRVLEERPGSVQIASYVEVGADHLAHAENYCLIAESAPRRPMGVVVQAKARGW